MTDDRIHQYLADRADAIELRPSDPSDIIRRAQRRRQRRRVGAAALCALAIGASALVVTQRDDPEAETSIASSGVVDSTFDWAVAEPSSGLGYSTSSALTDDGAIYSLSTAPGQAAPDSNPWAERATLYRSEQGAEWATVDLPGDLWASALAGSGEQLYAVGTAPAGGGAAYRLATTDDAGQSWAETNVPSDLTELQQRYGPEVSTSKPNVAVHDGTVIVTASIVANIDVESRIPGGVPPGFAFWTETEDGIVVSVGSACTPRDGWAPGPTVAPEPASDPTAAADPPPDGCEQVPYTWDDLGIDEELGGLIGGRSFVYVSRDGGEFEPVDLGEGRDTYPTYVVATDDGFTLFAWQSPGDGATGTTRVLHSDDGTAWEQGAELPGIPQATGVQDGRPAVALMQDASVLVRIAQPDGSWSSVDPRSRSTGLARHGSARSPSAPWAGSRQCRAPMSPVPSTSCIPSTAHRWLSCPSPTCSSGPPSAPSTSPSAPTPSRSGSPNPAMTT